MGRRVLSGMGTSRAGPRPGMYNGISWNMCKAVALREPTEPMHFLLGVDMLVAGVIIIPVFGELLSPWRPINPQPSRCLQVIVRALVLI